MSEGGPRIGSLFAGYEGLGMAVESVLGGSIAWQSEIEPGACKILAHRYPGVPNLGDITAVDWSAVEPVDVLTGGFPCQDVSCAGLRKGLRPDTRSGLWTQFAYAIDQLRPGLVVIENVRGLLSAGAHSDLEPCPWCVGDGGGSPLRALGAVLGDLADIGYDASWQLLRASDVGAPHGRARVFVIAWPAAHSEGHGRHEGRTEPARFVGGPDAAERGASVAADAIGGGWDGWTPEPLGVEVVGAALAGRSEGAGRGGDLSAIPTEAGPGEELRDMRDTAGTEALRQRPARGPVSVPAEAELLAGVREHEGRAVVEGRAPLASQAAPSVGVRDVRGDQPAARASQGPEPGEQRTGEPSDSLRFVPPAAALVGGSGAAACGCAAWGQYAPAIHGWEAVLGRPAPAPTELSTKGTHRLSPAAVEFMMGLPVGWVTDVPGLSRNEQLKALGNGVVPQQAAHALRLLLPDVGAVAA